MAQFNENVELLNASGITVQLRNAQGDIIAGGSGVTGSLTLKNGTGLTRIELNGTLGDATIGGSGVDGDITLKTAADKTSVRLTGAANMFMGGNGTDGDILLYTTTGDNKVDTAATIRLNGGQGDLAMGGNGVNGDILLKSTTGDVRVRLLGDANCWIGGNGAGGDVVLFKSSGDNATLANATVHLNGDAGDIRLGCNGTQGDIVLKGDNNKDRVRLLGDANMWMGGNGADGDIVLFKSDGDNTTLERATIHLDGQSGNIRCNDVNIPGADFAEDFDIDLATLTTLEPGTVMVLGRDGKLLESTEAFDRKVAGVVSGAGKYKAGIILDKQLDQPNRMPIALSGKVMCKIDASYGSISVGDLITTSPRKGYAMKASDPFQAFGAVIGKALADFPAGDGMLPILVALQ